MRDRAIYLLQTGVQVGRWLSFAAQDWRTAQEFDGANGALFAKSAGTWRGMAFSLMERTVEAP